MDKKEVGLYDAVELQIGYNKYIVPRKAAMDIFELFNGYDVYQINSRYQNGKDMPMARSVDEGFLSIRILNPVTFLTAIENQRQQDEKDEAARRAKDGV